MKKLEKGREVRFGGIILLAFTIALGGLAPSAWAEVAAADCRACHEDPNGLNQYMPVVHHEFVDTPLPPTSLVYTDVQPYDYYMTPDADEDGVNDAFYTCLNCHMIIWDPVLLAYVLDEGYRDCLNCHAMHQGTINAAVGTENGIITVSGSGLSSYQTLTGYTVINEFTNETISASCTTISVSDTEIIADCGTCYENISIFDGPSAQVACMGPERCRDGFDNDGDGLIDCEDSFECPCIEICDDRMDNDKDGLIDCLDSDCSKAKSCREDCADGLDNDMDYLVDCADVDDCSRARACK